MERIVAAIAIKVKRKRGMLSFTNRPPFKICGRNQNNIKKKTTTIAGAATVSDPRTLAMMGMLVIGKMAIMRYHKTLDTFVENCRIDVLAFIYSFSFNGNIVAKRKPRIAPHKINIPRVPRTGSALTGAFSAKKNSIAGINPKLTAC